MTRDDLHTLSTALAFAGMMLKGDKGENPTERINGFAKLIEAYCLDTSSSPENDPESIDIAIEQYKAELVAEGSAQLPNDRETLVRFYDRLLLRQIRSQQREFYSSGPASVIADRILKLVEAEIEDAETHA